MQTIRILLTNQHNRKKWPTQNFPGLPSVIHFLKKCSPCLQDNSSVYISYGRIKRPDIFHQKCAVFYAWWWEGVIMDSKAGYNPWGVEKTRWFLPDRVRACRILNWLTETRSWILMDRVECFESEIRRMILDQSSKRLIVWLVFQFTQWTIPYGRLSGTVKFEFQFQNICEKWIMEHQTEISIWIYSYYPQSKCSARAVFMTGTREEQNWEKNG